MTEDEEYDGDAVSDLTFGYWSNAWLLKALIYYAPASQVWNGVCRMIDYLTLDDDPEIGTALDVLAQVAANGSYTPTYEHGEGEHEGVHPMNPVGQGRNQGRMSFEEQEALLDEFRATLGLVPEQDEEKEGETDE